MPDCWFALIKLYVRVDGVLVRTRETRLFHRFSASEPFKVSVEVLWKEAYCTDERPHAASPAAGYAPLHQSSAITATMKQSSEATRCGSVLQQSVVREAAGETLPPAPYRDGKTAAAMPSAEVHVSVLPAAAFFTRYENAGSLMTRIPEVNDHQGVTKFFSCIYSR
jgi:hypothetical protein